MPRGSRSTIVGDWSLFGMDIRAVNPELADIIDAISPDETYALVKASYLYGDNFVKHGVAYFPDSKTQDLLPLTDLTLSKQLKDILRHHTTPPFLVLTKCSEIYIETSDRIIPLNLFNKGWMSGLYECMDILTTGMPSKYNWHFTAGSRSIFMLPKVQDRLALNRLATAFHLPSAELANRKLTDQWSIFKAIAQSPDFDQDWHNDIIFFGHKWFDKKNDSPAWQRFRDYFVKQGWLQAQYSIAKINFAFEWGKYVEALTVRRLKPQLHLIDQLRHLFCIASGYYPGFIPADDSQEIAPTAKLKQAFVDVYDLREYFPTIMHASSVKDFQHHQPVYYSLAVPTLLDGSSMKKASSTMLEDLRQIKFMLETIRHYPPLQDDNTPLKNVTFDYFHTGYDKSGEILLSSEVFEKDPYFIEKEIVPDKQTFCASSLFFRGCLKICANA